MKNLFVMECKKIVKSVSYWLYVIALLTIGVQNYNIVVENELRQTDNPASVFYIAKNGIYAETATHLKEDMQHTMMVGATRRLLNNYQNNRYEYYPFGYVKEKTFSPEEQAIILSYLQELTGLNELSLTDPNKSSLTDLNKSSLTDLNKSSLTDPNKSSLTDPNESSLTGLNEPSINEKEENSNLEDFQISGDGAYILNPGQGRVENGQFISEPEDWEYMENGSNITESFENTQNAFDVQVSFERFKEIMSSVNAMIGRNSYFSLTMLTMYYGENDMQNTPITELQHKEFYEKDHVTGAFARYFCDSISLVILCLPAFVIIDLLLRDKRHKIRALIYPKTESSAKIICTRFSAAIGMVMLPILILPLKSLVILINYCNRIGIHANLFAFITYTFAWILPTVLLIVALGLLVTVLTENYSAVLLLGLIWLIGKPSVDKIAGGNYGLFDLIIRHNTLKGYGRMMENIQILILNRVLISVAALILVVFTIMIYEKKRKGGITVENRKLIDNYRCKHSHKL